MKTIYGYEFTTPQNDDVIQYSDNTKDLYFNYFKPITELNNDIIKNKTLTFFKAKTNSDNCYIIGTREDYTLQDFIDNFIVVR